MREVSFDTPTALMRRALHKFLCLLILKILIHYSSCGPKLLKSVVNEAKYRTRKKVKDFRKSLQYSFHLTWSFLRAKENVTKIVFTYCTCKTQIIPLPNCTIVAILLYFSFNLEDFQCHSECIGGCVNSTANGCTACTHYRIKGHDTCVDKCPAHLFIFGNMCVPPEFCIKHQKKPFQGECHDACPPNYVDTDIDGKPLPLDNPCTKCVYQCNLRECPGGEIDSLDMSLYWKGCQIVRGDLYIRLRFGVSDTISILERNLGDIEEIDGLLKIYRSPAIKSLEFFRSLRKIHGSNLHEDKYSFVLMENENLESLWDFREKKSLRLVKGNLLIHYNSKLCNEDIVALQKLVNTNPAEDFIGQDSNGFEDACTQRDIETDFYEVTHKSINIRWERLEYNNIRPIGYIIFYIEAPERNITHLELHSCGR